jgi:hypothetical protein
MLFVRRRVILIVVAVDEKGPAMTATLYDFSTKQ